MADGDRRHLVERATLALERTVDVGLVTAGRLLADGEFPGRQRLLELAWLLGVFPVPLNIRAAMRAHMDRQPLDRYAGPTATFPEASRVRLRVLQGELDRALQGGAARAACRAGCDACCHQHVPVSSLEADAMVAAFEAKHGARALVDLAAAARERHEQGASMTVSDVWRARRPCLFLRDNLCDVYEARPSGCRALFVVSDPALCGLPSAAITFVRNIAAESVYQRRVQALDGGGLRTLHTVVLEVLAGRGVVEVHG